MMRGPRESHEGRPEALISGCTRSAGDTVIGCSGVVRGFSREECRLAGVRWPLAIRSFLHSSIPMSVARDGPGLLWTMDLGPSPIPQACSPRDQGALGS